MRSSITLGNPSKPCCLIPVCDPLFQVHSDQARSSGGVGVGPHTLCNFKGDSCRSVTSKYQSGLGRREDFKRFARWSNYVKLKWIGMRFCDSESFQNSQLCTFGHKSSLVPMHLPPAMSWTRMATCPELALTVTTILRKVMFLATDSQKLCFKWVRESNATLLLEIRSKLKEGNLSFEETIGTNMGQTDKDQRKRREQHGTSGAATGTDELRSLPGLRKFQSLLAHYSSEAPAPCSRDTLAHMWNLRIEMNLTGKLLWNWPPVKQHETPTFRIRNRSLMFTTTSQVPWYSDDPWCCQDCPGWATSQFWSSPCFQCACSAPYLI